MSNQHEGEERREESPHRGIKWDATINLGHILTFIGFLLAGFGAWSNLDKRVTIVEESKYLQKQVDSSQDIRSAEAAGQIKEVLQRLDRQIERIADRLDKPGGRP